jgi:hypothetical protein
MPLDPQIALQVQQPQITAQPIQPLQQFQAVASLRDMMAQQQLRNMQMQKYQQEIADQQFKADNLRKFQSLYQPGKPEPTVNDIYGALGPDGTKVVSEQMAAEKEQLANQKSHAERLSNRANNILTEPTDFNYQLNIKQAIADGDLPADVGNQLLTQSITNPQTLAAVRSFRDSAMSAKDQQSFAFNALDNAHKLVEGAAKAGQAQQEQTQKELATASQTVGTITDKGQLPAWLSQQGPNAQKFYAGLIASNVPLDDIKNTIQLGGVATKPGETMPLPASVQTQKVEQQAAQGLAAANAQILAKNLNNQQLAAEVLKNPNLYAQIPPEKQTEIAPLLAKQGFTQFTQKPTDTELKTLYDTQRNLKAVQDMKADFATGKYDWITGPIMGHMKDLPWGTEGKTLEAGLDELRSTVGDLVKGGTLRSSDLATYQKMFPNTTDPTPVIKNKLDLLEKRLSNDLGTYTQSLRSSGRAVPGEAPAAPAAGQAQPSTQPGAAPATGTIVEGRGGKRYQFVGGDPNDRKNWPEFHPNQ